MWHSSAPGVTDCRVSHWALVHQAPLSLDLAHSASQMNLVRDTVLLHRHGKKKKSPSEIWWQCEAGYVAAMPYRTQELDMDARSNTLRWMLISGSMLVLPVTFQLCQTSISCSHFHVLDVAADTCWFSKLLFHFNHLFSSTCSSVSLLLWLNISMRQYYLSQPYAGCSAQSFSMLLCENENVASTVLTTTTFQ